jgi:hypothetical protein
MPAHDVVAVTREPGKRSGETARRLVVTWQHPDERLIEPIGLLDYDGDCYRFGYIQHALAVKDFRPLLGFRDLYGSYASEHLFPLFAQRVMDPRRPDYQRYVARLGLPEDASPWEQIARSQGRRQDESRKMTLLFLATSATRASDYDTHLAVRRLPLRHSSPGSRAHGTRVLGTGQRPGRSFTPRELPRRG